MAVDGWMAAGGWMDGWMAGWMDGWIDRLHVQVLAHDGARLLWKQDDSHQMLAQPQFVARDSLCTV